MLTCSSLSGYPHCAPNKAGHGIDSPERHRRTSATLGAFFVPLWRRCVGGFGLPGSYVPGLSTRVPSPPLIDSDAGDSTDIGVPTMAKLRLFPTRDLSARAAAHRAMARASLFADSSARTRLKRYNHHAEQARRLEAAARGQEVVS